jgi:protein involved in polysaccharide export with SLBB domain
MKRITRWVALVVLVGAFAVARPAQAQTQASWDPAQLQMTRSGLTELQERLAQAAESKAYSKDLRDRARTQSGLVARRLADGDFQVGDQVALDVEGEEKLGGTFAVAPGLVLTLPLVGDIPLKGVLRSELQDHVTKHLSQYIRNPVVHTRSLIRISITGQVGKPGFYVVPSESLVTDVLMMGGGPAGNADISMIEIERGGSAIWGGQPLQDAITQGRTLDQLSLRAGDRIVLPERKASGGTAWRQALGAAGSVALIVSAFARWF